jgi:cysteine/glycine-rich protein
MAPKWGGGAPKCPTCDKSVYEAEKVLALGQSFHKLCLKCTADGCGKILEPSKVLDHEGKLYCDSCHKKSFGPKGYGFAGGSSGLETGQNAPPS